MTWKFSHQGRTGCPCKWAFFLRVLRTPIPNSWGGSLFEWYCAWHWTLYIKNCVTPQGWLDASPANVPFFNGCITQRPVVAVLIFLNANFLAAILLRPLIASTPNVNKMVSKMVAKNRSVFKLHNQHKNGCHPRKNCAFSACDFSKTNRFDEAEIYTKYYIMFLLLTSTFC